MWAMLFTMLGGASSDPLPVSARMEIPWVRLREAYLRIYTH